MTRVAVVLFCLAFILMLTPNRRRSEAELGRVITRQEMAYHLPRIGSRREAVLTRLGRVVSATRVGTQLGLALSAVLVWFLPANSLAGPVLLGLLAWAGGQTGRMVGAVRGSAAGPDLVSWRDVVGTGFAWLWGAAVALAVAFAGWLALAWPGQPGLALIVLAGTAMVVGVAVAGGRRALAASSFVDADVPRPWTEALRGEGVRAAAVLVPGATGALVTAVGAMALDRLGLVVAPLGFGFAGVLLLVVAMALGLRALGWHAGRVRDAGADAGGDDGR